jgi:aspartate beta-hydroxylase
MSATLFMPVAPSVIQGTIDSAPEHQQVKTFLEKLGADTFGHANAHSLCQHLLQTRQILARWGCPVWIQNGGALHSIYSTDVYKRQLIPFSDREMVRCFAGIAAERAAFLFCTLPRQRLFAALDRAANTNNRADELEVGSDSGVLLETLNPQDRDALLLIHMANEAEQAQGPNGGPGVFLHHLAGLAAHLESDSLRPGFLPERTEIPSRDQERQARDSYLRGLEAMLAGDRNQAPERFIESSFTCPVWAEPTLWRAYLALQMGDLPETVQLCSTAKLQLLATGFAWDKRLSYREWLWLACALDRLASEGRRPFTAVLNRRFADLTRRFEGAKHQASETPAGSQEKKAEAAPVPQPVANQGTETTSTFVLSRRFERYLSLFANHPPDAKMFHFPDLPSQPFFDPQSFAIVAALEANFEEIRAEVLALGDHSYHQEHEKSIKRTGSWDVFMLYERGRKNQGNTAMCPTISRIIEGHNTVRTLAGLMYLSKMSPHTVIQPHRGPTNMRLRCHLGIQVPQGDCAIKVGGETRRWQEGKCLVFDDNYPHEAWNHTDELRRVLIVDIWHPNLSDDERVLLEGLHRFAMAQTLSLNSYWSGNEKARKHSYD